MVVYAALYNSMTCESSASPISLHHTKKGAYQAMRAHRVKECVDERDSNLMFGNDLWAKDHRFDDWKWWGVEEMRIVA